MYIHRNELCPDYTNNAVVKALHRVIMHFAWIVTTTDNLLVM